MSVKDKVKQAAISVQDNIKQAAGHAKDHAQHILDSAKKAATPIIEPVRHKGNKIKNDLQTQWELLKLGVEQKYTDSKYSRIVETRDPTLTDSANYIYDQMRLAVKEIKVVGESANRAWNEEKRHAQTIADYQANPLVEEERPSHNDDL